MADEESLGIVQFVVILLITLVFGGVLIAVVLLVGGKKKEKAVSDESSPKSKVEELKSDKAKNSADDAQSKQSSTKNAKRSGAISEHPKQLCILKGHTSDVLYIEFTSNGKLLGSTSSGRK